MAFLDGRGDIWLFWQRKVDPNDRQIWFRRYRKEQQTWDEDPEAQVDTGEGRAREPYAVEDAGGNIILFYRFGSHIHALQFDRADDDWVPTSDQLTNSGTSYAPFALVDSTGRIWLFYEGDRPNVTGRKIYSQVYSAGAWSTPEEARSHTHGDHSCMAIEDSEGTIWLFWSHSDTGVYKVQYTVYDPSTTNWSFPGGPPPTTGRPPLSTAPPLTSGSIEDLKPFVIMDSDGALWLLLTNYASDSESVLQVKRRHKGAADWGSPMNLTAPGELNRYSSAVQDSNGAIWLFWQAKRSGTYDIYYRHVLPTI